MNAPALLSLASLAALALPSPAAEDTDLYDLAQGLLGKEAPWSGDGAGVQLAPGEDGKLDFKLPDLPPHEFLKVAVEVEIPSPIFRLNDTGSEAEERLKIATADGRTLFDASFSTGEGGQSFPDHFGSFVHKPRTGANDGRYRFELLFPHTADTLGLAFHWHKAEPAPGNGIAIQINGLNLGGDAPDYSITRLKIIALGDTPPLDKEGADTLFEKIAGDNAMVAVRAVNQLIAAGDTALPFVRGRFTATPDPEIEAKIAKLAEGLRSDAFKERAAAQAALGELGPEALPHLAKLLTDRDALTADVRYGLEVVKTRIEGDDDANPDHALANRLRPALELLASDGARAVEKLLPAKRKIIRHQKSDDEDGVIDIPGGKLKFDLNFGK